MHILLCALVIAGFSWANEAKTYKEDISKIGKYQTGLVKALSPEEHQLKLELDELAEKGEISFDYDPTKAGKFATGLVSPPPGHRSRIYTIEELHLGTEKLRPMDFRLILGDKTPSIRDQKSCGSCVVFAFTAVMQWMSALFQVDIPLLSQQHLMNCGGGNPGQCSGDFGENVARRAVSLKSLAQLTDYPYTARNGSCKNTDSLPKFGKAESYKTISGDFKSILAALNSYHPLAVGVAADNRFMSYAGGVYNGFGSMGTNHYVTIIGAGCGSSMDKDGYCSFNSDGVLINGNHEATIIIANSWGAEWGENGFMTLLFQNKSGKRNNNIAGGEANVQLLENGLPIPPPPVVEPVTVLIENSQVALKVVVQPGSPAAADKVKEMLSQAINSLED